MRSNEEEGGVGLLILAAGSSTRLGTPKQLLIYNNQTLLHRVAQTALASDCHPIVVVLGAHAQNLQAEVDSLPLKTVVNAMWPEGMGSSIRSGMAYLTGRTNTSAVIIMLCDQPYVGSKSINKFVIAHRTTNAQLIAAHYNNTVGTPALFGRQFYRELLALTGQQGAKNILLANSTSLMTMSMPEAAVDLDTLEDYENIKENA